MNLFLSAIVAVTFGVGVFLLLRRDLLKIVIGLGLIGNAVNLAIFVLGGWKLGTVPLMSPNETTLSAASIDPVPQALVLTAIVIGFAMQAFLLVLARLQIRNSGTSDSQAVEDSSQ